MLKGIRVTESCVYSERNIMLKVGESPRYMVMLILVARYYYCGSSFPAATEIDLRKEIMPLVHLDFEIAQTVCKGGRGSCSS